MSLERPRPASHAPGRQLNARPPPTNPVGIAIDANPDPRLSYLLDGGCGLAVKAPDCGSGYRGFESRQPPLRRIAAYPDWTHPGATRPASHGILSIHPSGRSAMCRHGSWENRFRSSRARMGRETRRPRRRRCAGHGPSTAREHRPRISPNASTSSERLRRCLPGTPLRKRKNRAKADESRDADPG